MVQRKFQRKAHMGRKSLREKGTDLTFRHRKQLHPNHREPEAHGLLKNQSTVHSRKWISGKYTYKYPQIMSKLCSHEGEVMTHPWI